MTIKCHMFNEDSLFKCTLMSEFSTKLVKLTHGMEYERIDELNTQLTKSRLVGCVLCAPPSAMNISQIVAINVELYG